MDKAEKKRENTPMLRHVKDLLLPHEGNSHHPKLLRHKHLFGMSAFLLLLNFSSLAISLALPGGQAQSTAISRETIVALTNRTREKEEVPLLVMDTRLNEAAQKKADEMATLGYFAHTSPEGKTALDFIRNHGYVMQYAAENLAVRYTQAEDVQQGWLLSPSHRRNILDPNYQDIGVGYSQGTYKNEPAIFVVQLFGQEKANAIVNGTRASSTTFVPAATTATSPLAGLLNEAAKRLDVFFILFLSALMLIAFSIRFQFKHIASMAHAMGVIGLAFVLLLS